MNNRPRHPCVREGWKLAENEPQQTQSSWAEFIAEVPVKPKRRSNKLQPMRLSMFEWALESEQGRRKEMVGAGR